MSLAMNSTVISGPQPNIYIPVHKRQSEKVPPALSLDATASEDAPLSSSWSSASSMSSVLPRSAHFSIASDNVNTKTRPPFVYTIEELLRLRNSSLVFVSPERREEIRRNVPEVYMNRKRRLEKDSRLRVKSASIRTNDTDGPHGHDDHVSLIPAPFSQYSQKLKRQEKDKVDQTSRSAVLTPIQPSTQSHPVPVDVLAKVSLVVPEAPKAITPLGYPQRRIRRFTEKRSRPKAVDELNWRGPRQRSWYTATQGAVSSSQ